MFAFRNNNIWKKSLHFREDIYKITKNFPNSDQTFSLRSQLVRASTSISANIADGWRRGSAIDLKRSAQASMDFLKEVVTCLYFAKDQQYIAEREFSTIYKKSEEISEMLRRYLEN